MKKIFNVILASAVAFSVASCNNERTGNEPENNGGKTAMQFSVAEAGLRADDGQQDVVGQAGESTVKGGVFLTPSGTIDFTLSETTPNSGVYESEKVLYTGATGSQKATLLVNAPSGVNANVTNPEQKISIDKLSNVADKEGFTMSAPIALVDIKEGIAKDQVTDENSNLFSYDVERVVSKVQVTMGSGEGVPTVGKNLENVGAFPKDKIYYAVAGGAKELYLFGDHKGKRTLGNDKTYADFKSAIHNVPVSTYKVENGVSKLDVPRPLTTVSERLLVAPFLTDASEAATHFKENGSLKVTPENNYKATSRTNGIFFYENSLGQTINKKGQLKLADITYVKVYANMRMLHDKKVQNLVYTIEYQYVCMCLIS